MNLGGRSITNAYLHHAIYDSTIVTQVVTSVMQVTFSGRLARILKEIKMKEVIVVAGATGHVGRPLAERLLAAGRAVRGVARDAEKLKPLAALGAEVRKGSLHDPVFLTLAFRPANPPFSLTPPTLNSPKIHTYPH